MLEESSDSPIFDIQNIREIIEDRGCYLRSTGLELLELLDSSIRSGIAGQETMERARTLFLSTSRFAFTVNDIAFQFLLNHAGIHFA